MTSKNGNSKKPASKPASVKPASKPATVPMSTAKSAKKERAPRKPAVERALKLAGQLDKKRGTLLKWITKWRGPATEEQNDACLQLRQTLQTLEAPLLALNSDLTFLRESGWKPTGGNPGRKPLQIGERVQIKEKQYDSAIHGLLNEFEVQQTTAKYILVRAVGNGKAAPIAVLRAWLTVLRTPGVDDAENAHSLGTPPTVGDID